MGRPPGRPESDATRNLVMARAPSGRRGPRWFGVGNTPGTARRPRRGLVRENRRAANRVEPLFWGARIVRRGLWASFKAPFRGESNPLQLFVLFTCSHGRTPAGIWVEERESDDRPCGASARVFAAWTGRGRPSRRSSGPLATGALQTSQLRRRVGRNSRWSLCPPAPLERAVVVGGVAGRPGAWNDPLASMSRVIGVDPGVYRAGRAPSAYPPAAVCAVCSHELAQ